MSEKFAALGIGPSIIEILLRSNITEPTPVQAEAIPVVMAGRDLVATAPTGTGKTGAFLLPILEKFTADAKPGRGPRMLVLSPTRELAQQIGKAAKQFSEGLQRVKTVTITGGESYQQQNKVLSRPYEILIATPGRLIDQLGSDRIDLSRVEVFVLDEADRMLDIGFTDAVLEIAGKLPENRQTLCFTATMSREVTQLANRLLKDPHRIDVGGETHSRTNITQRVLLADDLNHKHRLLRHILENEASEGQVIVFTATKRDADSIAESLTESGLVAIALHGDLSQKQRNRSLQQVRSGESRILVATDVAARGIDVSGISHVINFDLPKTAEDYVHRIGRTGRAGANGDAISFIGRADGGALYRIERFVGAKIDVMTIPGMEAHFTPDSRSSRGPRDGQRRPGGGYGGRGGQSRPYQSRDGGRDGGGGYGGRDRAPYPRDNAGGDRRPPRGPRYDGPRNDDSRGNDSRGNDSRGNDFRGNNDSRGYAPRPYAPRGDASRGDGPRGPRSDAPRGPRNDDARGERKPRPQGDRPAYRGPAHAEGNIERGNAAPRGNNDENWSKWDERQPDFNEDRQPRFLADKPGGYAGKRYGADNRGGSKPPQQRDGRGPKRDGQGPNRDGQRTGYAGRGKKPMAGEGAGQGAFKRRDAKPGAGGPHRGGRRPKQVGLYVAPAPSQRADWRNERLSDAPRKPKVVRVERKGETSSEPRAVKVNVTARTLRLKKKEKSEE